MTQTLNAAVALAASQAPAPTDDQLPPPATFQIIAGGNEDSATPPEVGEKYAPASSSFSSFPPVGTDAFAKFKARYDCTAAFTEEVVPFTLQAGGLGGALQRYASDDVTLIGLAGETVVAGRDEYLAVSEGIAGLRDRLLIDTSNNGGGASVPLFQLIDASSSSSSPSETPALTVTLLDDDDDDYADDDDEEEEEEENENDDDNEVDETFRLAYRWTYSGGLRLPSQREAASQALGMGAMGGPFPLPQPLQQLLLSSSSNSSAEVKLNVSGIFRYTFSLAPRTTTTTTAASSDDGFAGVLSRSGSQGGGGGYGATLRRHSVDEMTVNGFELESSALAGVVKNAVASGQKAGGGGTIQELAGLAAWLLSKSDRGSSGSSGIVSDGGGGAGGGGKEYRPTLKSGGGGKARSTSKTKTATRRNNNNAMVRTRGDLVVAFLEALHRDLPYLAVQLPAQAFLAPDVTLRGQLREPLASGATAYSRLLGGVASASRRLLEEGLLAPLNDNDGNSNEDPESRSSSSSSSSSGSGSSGGLKRKGSAAAAAAAAATTYRVEYTREGHVRVPWRVDLAVVAPFPLNQRLPLCVDAVSLFVLDDEDGNSDLGFYDASNSGGGDGGKGGGGGGGATAKQQQQQQQQEFPLVKEHRLLEVSLNGQPSLAKVVEWAGADPQKRGGATMASSVQLLEFLTRVAGGGK